MTWPTPLVVYHGCDLAAERSIRTLGINTALGRPRTDFGQGFYVTTNLHQAKNWANARYWRRRRAPGNWPAVLEFHVDRSALATIADTVFLLDGPDFWTFVAQCRTLAPGAPLPHAYAVVWGPVSLWPQRLVVKDCDQMSVHNQAVVPLLSVQPTSITPPAGQLAF